MTWHQEAACVGHPVDWWFPAEADRSAERWDAGRLVCRSCPVREQCLAESLQDEADKPRSLLFGMRGGLSPAQRERVGRGLPAELPAKETTPKVKPARRPTNGHGRECACSPCTEKRRRIWRNSKRRGAARSDPIAYADRYARLFRHGTVSAYKRGCRCTGCVEARRDVWRKEMQRRRDRKAEGVFHREVAKQALEVHNVDAAGSMQRPEVA